MSYARRPKAEADVDGAPHLVVREEDREAIAEILAALLIAVLEARLSRIDE
jgi:hypothetical protein